MAEDSRQLQARFLGKAQKLGGCVFLSAFVLQMLSGNTCLPSSLPMKFHLLVQVTAQPECRPLSQGTTLL